MPLRPTLGLCLLALATPAVAQQATDPVALPGIGARERDEDGARLLRTETAPDEASSAKPKGAGTGEAAAPRGISGLDLSAAEAGATAGDQGRVRPQAPLTTGSIPPSPEPLAEEGAFGGDTERDAARGIRAGGLLIFPELALRGGVTDNAAGAPGGGSGSFYRVEPSVRLSSDWDRHQLDATLRGAYQGFTEDTDNDSLSLEYEGSVRLDAGDQTTITGDLAYALETESGSDAESASGSGKRVLSHDIEGGLAVTREVGVVAATLRGTLGGSVYTGGIGGTNRNNMLATAGLRLGYGIGAPLSPFAEATVLGRLYEDAPGRDAIGYELRGGLRIDRGDKLTGEIAVGYHLEDLEGATFKTLEGVLVEAALTWSPTRLTTVTLDATTAFEASSLAGASGSVVYGGGLSVAHSLSRSLAVDAGVAADYRRYQGLALDEVTLSGTVGATYAITDFAALQTRFTHDRFDSSQPGGDYTANTIEAGIRLRR